MNFDLKSMSPKELKALQKKIDTALARVTGKEKKAALAAVEKVAKVHGFALADLIETGSAKAALKTKAKVKKQPALAKYANPSDKTQTWTGKGRQPGWFKDAIGAGKRAADLVI